MKKGILSLTIFGIILKAFFANGQIKDEILQNAFSQYHSKMIAEKIYIQTDKNYYVAGEICWFKFFVVSSMDLKPMNLSHIGYLQILNKNKEDIFHIKIDIQNGFGQGSFIVPKTMETGNYILCAFTAYMQNFGEDYFFTKEIRILNASLGPSSTKLDTSSHLRKYDLQFFPEGGNLIEEVPGVLGVRVVNEQGKGIDYLGCIVNSKNDTLCRFKPLKFGLGKFDFEPKKGESYRAILFPKGGKPFQQSLPSVFPNGYSLKITDTDSHNLKIEVLSSGTAYPEELFLVVQCRENLELSQSIFLNNSKFSSHISKDSLLEGVSQITLFDSKHRPLCERLIYKFPKLIKLKFEDSLKVAYSKRKLINFTIKLPFSPHLDSLNLSLAVRLDDSLDKDINAPGLVNYLFLQSDIKGIIEDPNFYTQENRLTREAMNNLLLTQGWRRFKWITLINNLKRPSLNLAYFPEIYGETIQGTLKNKKTQKPLVNTLMFLSFPSIHPKFYTSITDSSGKYQFLNIKVKGEHDLVIKAFSPSDTNFTINKENFFSNPQSSNLLCQEYKAFFSKNYEPNYSNLNELELRNSSIQVEYNFYKDKFQNISFNDPDSIPFYGKPDVHYNFDDYVRFPTMKDIFIEYIRLIKLTQDKGQNHLFINQPELKVFFDQDPFYLIDGVPVFNLNPILNIDPLKLKSLDIILNRYHYGPSISDGIFSFKTYHGDLNGYPIDSKEFIDEFEGVALEREFFSPIYSSFSQQETTKPDFRTTLYWNPNLKPNYDGQYPVSFYSSDITGSFLINLIGITKNGKMIEATSQLKIVP